jgi:hypothetical protein
MSNGRNLSIATFAITALLCTSGHAQDKTFQCPPQAKQEIAKAYPSLSFDGYECAKGDLDHDGIPDVAALIQYTSDKAELAQVLILRGSRSGHYAIIEKSSVYSPDMHRTEYTSIRKGSLFLTASSHSSDTYAGTSYQFKLVKGEFVLIGLEASRGYIGKSKPAFRRSVNFMTGKLIETRENHGRPIMQERRIATPPHALLQEFTLDDVGGMVFKEAE